MAFVLKSVNATGRIGPDLIELRERSGWTRAEVSRQTKIPESIVRGWEEELWEDMDDPVYMERVFRSYVIALGGDEPYFIGKYHEVLKERHLERKLQDLLPRPRRIRLLDLTVGSRLLTFVAFLTFVSLLGGYVYLQARAISTPPPLALSEPEDGSRLVDPEVTIKGTTLPEASVTINGRTIIVQPDGNFSLTMNVPRGTTLLVVSARKRHGREALLTRRVVYERAVPSLPTQ